MVNMPLLTNEILSRKIYIYMYVLSCIIIPFSPYLGYIFLLLGMILFSYGVGKFFSYSSFLLASFAQFYILHSRRYIVEQEFDLGGYYYAYSNLIYNSIGDASNHSLEIGWFVVYKMIGLINSNLNIFDIALLNSAICILIFFVWLVKYGTSYIEKKYLGFVLGIIVLFMWPTNFPFFQRQAISVAILLFAISNIKNKKYFIFYLVLSASFHLTSLVMGLIYYILVQYDIKNLAKKIIVSLTLFRIVFSFVLTYLITFVGNADLVRKAGFYTENGMSGFFAFSELRFFPLFLLAFIFYKKIDKDWRNIILFSSLFYISLIGIQFASGRFNFILVYLYGFFLWLIAKRQAYILLIYVLLYFVFDMIYKANFIGVINDPFWQRYPFFNYIPFYYLGM